MGRFKTRDLSLSLRSPTPSLELVSTRPHLRRPSASPALHQVRAGSHSPLRFPSSFVSGSCATVASSALFPFFPPVRPLADLPSRIPPVRLIHAVPALVPHSLLPQLFISFPSAAPDSDAFPRFRPPLLRSDGLPSCLLSFSSPHRLIAQSPISHLVHTHACLALQATPNPPSSGS
ncbi:hypothetical protein GY45DRAFT_296101 [Cubamyces sp. BRFM 1775]|nr:hypothetical protein GY45DRAFT_296101 [Cubamyces sp. BRFM 1775]